ncbi:MAG: hypothetical protein AAF902_20795, partial [Chloroflexota bacterium]
MGSNYDELLNQVNEIHDLEKATWLLGWDREVNLSLAGAEIRSKQLGTINKLVHRMSTSDEMGELIEKASDELIAEGMAEDTTEMSLVRLLERNFSENKSIPEDYVRRAAEAQGKGMQAWKVARAESDFSKFSSSLATTIELCQELAEYKGYKDEKYDALLSPYERGMKTADVQRVFDSVKAATVPLIEAISEKQHLVD